MEFCRQIGAVSSRASSIDVECLRDNPGLSSLPPFLPSWDSKSLSTLPAWLWASQYPGIVGLGIPTVQALWS